MYQILNYSLCIKTLQCLNYFIKTWIVAVNQCDFLSSNIVKYSNCSEMHAKEHKGNIYQIWEIASSPINIKYQIQMFYSFKMCGVFFSMLLLLLLILLLVVMVFVQSIVMLVLSFCFKGD